MWRLPVSTREQTDGSVKMWLHKVHQCVHACWHPLCDPMESHRDIISETIPKQPKEKSPLGSPTQRPQWWESPRARTGHTPEFRSQLDLDCVTEP